MLDLLTEPEDVVNNTAPERVVYNGIQLVDFACKLAIVHLQVSEMNYFL